MAAVEAGNESVQSGERSPADEVASDSAFVRSPSVRSLPSGSSTDTAVLSLKTWLHGSSRDTSRSSLGDKHSPTTETRLGPFYSSILKSPRLQITSSQSLPVTKIPTTLSPPSARIVSASSSAEEATSHGTRQQPVATPPPSLVPYYLVDVEVQLKKGCHDILLQGRVGVVRSIDKKMATVQITNHSSDITIPHESLQPVTPRPSDTVKVIGGNDAVLGLIGTLVSTLGKEGVIQFLSHNKQRRKNPAQIPLSQLGRYAPKSKFPSALPSGGAFFPNNIGIVGKGSAPSSRTTTTNETTPVLFPLVYAVPSQVQTSLGPFFSSGRPLSSSITALTSSLGTGQTGLSLSYSMPSASRIDSTSSVPSLSRSSGNAVWLHDGNLQRIGGRSEDSAGGRLFQLQGGSDSRSVEVDSARSGSPRASQLGGIGDRSTASADRTGEMPLRMFRAAKAMAANGNGSLLTTKGMSRISSPMVGGSGGRPVGALQLVSPSSRTSGSQMGSNGGRLSYTQSSGVRSTESGPSRAHDDETRSSSQPQPSKVFESLHRTASQPGMTLFRFGGERSNGNSGSSSFSFSREKRKEEVLPDSTTNGIERDSLFKPPSPKRTHLHASSTSAIMAATRNDITNSLTGGHSSKPNWNQNRASLALTPSQSQSLRQLPRSPFMFATRFSDNMSARNRAMVFLNDTKIVGRGGSPRRPEGLGMTGHRELVSAVENGTNTKEVLKNLVKDQRNYAYELTSPSTPGCDVKTSCVRVSLICPLSQQRMKYPSRGKACKHLQCFDAENYINFHEKQMMRKKIKQIGHYSKPAHDKKWNCPICERITFIPQLYIDKALMKLVNESSETTEVELSRNGSWVHVTKSAEVEVIDLTDD